MPKTQFFQIRKSAKIEVSILNGKKLFPIHAHFIQLVKCLNVSDFKNIK